MCSFEDFEVLSILGTHANSTCYKVRNKQTAEILTWKAINYEENPQDHESLKRKFTERKEESHPELLKFHDYLLHEENMTIYLITEFCEQGSLYNVITRCLKDETYVEEDYIWCWAYKLASYYKLRKEVSFNVHEIFIDEKNNVKIFNFPLTNKMERTTLPKTLYKLIHLIADDKEKEFPSYYSNDLKILLNFLLTEEDSSIDAILCHPTALLKLTKAKSKDIYVKSNGINCETVSEEIGSEKLYFERLEVLRKREATLKINEEKLKERAHGLDKREKKIALMERIAKEKTARAELYLKRAREQKGSTVGINRGVPKTILEKTDTSFSADCGDNSILPTSKKLNLEEIIRPTKFTRTFSERRVRFKSHSPLKEIHNIPKQSVSSDSDKTSDTHSEKSKKKFALSSMFSKKSKKVPNSIASSSDSVSAHTYEDLDKGWEENRQEMGDCKPLNWTQESKRHAFDLLRIMNGEADGETFCPQLKHTFL